MSELPVETIQAKSQRTVYVTTAQNPSVRPSIWGSAPNIVVDRNMLKDYLSDYHHQNPNGRCKADGQDWPCKTYSHLYEKAFGKEPFND